MMDDFIEWVAGLKQESPEDYHETMQALLERVERLERLQEATDRELRRLRCDACCCKKTADGRGRDEHPKG